MGEPSTGGLLWGVDVMGTDWAGQGDLPRPDTRAYLHSRINTALVYGALTHTYTCTLILALLYPPGRHALTTLYSGTNTRGSRASLICARAQACQLSHICLVYFFIFVFTFCHLVAKCGRPIPRCEDWVGEIGYYEPSCASKKAWILSCIILCATPPSEHSFAGPV